ncbi:MAG TPA: hypothetical protein VF594_04235 [Rubricoccaceae bacterium]|jgi:hypothetical protein
MSIRIPRLALPLVALLAGAVSAQAPDPRVGLSAGLTDAGQAIRGLELVAHVPRPAGFFNPDDPGDFGYANTDLAFRGDLMIVGNYGGVQMWDISDPAAPRLRASLECPGGQGDVSVHGNLLFMSVEETRGRVDCGAQGVEAPVSAERFRGVRILDISDVEHPRQVASVQTCRGSHTHTLVPDPADPSQLFVYVSGTSRVRPGEELAGCSSASPLDDPASALFRIEVIRVPLANPAAAAIVATPRFLLGLAGAPEHGMAQADIEAVAEARRRGAFTAVVEGEEIVVPDMYVQQMLAGIVQQRGGTGAATAADSAALRVALPGIVAQMVGPTPEGPRPGPNQCHDITAFPEVGLAGGACAGYGLLLDISDPANPTRLTAAADSNFAYWHSATFSNDGRRVVFTDEWGGGSAPRCRATDRPEWGANALFSITDARELDFEGYYKLPAAQTETENCVAHNGSIVPVPGRDLMVQAWYQGGLSLFDFTNPSRPVEIAYFDRGPVDADELVAAGYWSVYWYNGYIYASEIGRGLDVFRLAPGDGLTASEIAAAEAVQMETFNPQTQTRVSWPATADVARAYVDGLERDGVFTATEVAMTRQAIDSSTPAARQTASAAIAAGAARADARTAERLRGLAETLAAMR